MTTFPCYMKSINGTVTLATGRRREYLVGTVIESEKYTIGLTDDQWHADCFHPIPPPNQNQHNMTKCTVIGQPNETKPIELVKVIKTDGTTAVATVKPTAYQNIELICEDFGHFDLMFAYDHNRNLGYLYLGHWNDGVAE